ncbi:MAG: hypothetical protein ACR2QM_16675 [Longimicrobiales bacterium]
MSFRAVAGVEDGLGIENQAAWGALLLFSAYHGRCLSVRAVFLGVLHPSNAPSIKLKYRWV